jgi:2-polyprenyl-6-methoxyphenol hydroxylase-like FAD-dependent oxidoreductase
VHVLQPGGLAALERLLPGYTADLELAGAIPLDIPEDILWMSAAGWVKRFAGRHVVMSASRDLIEWVTRRRVIESPQVLVRAGLEVPGLMVRHGRVTGVEVRSRAGGRDGPVALIEADLVVDATGRRGHAPGWLRDAGYAPPDETIVDSGLAYSTRLYRRCPDDTPGWLAALIQSAPPHQPRAGILFPIEGDRWMLTVSSAGGEVPPTDEPGFDAFLRTLRTPDVADVAARLEPLGPIVGYRRTANHRRHYESLRDMPDGLLVVGDAACAFNPVYGQGMSAAALSAEAVDRCLTAHLSRTGDLRGVSRSAQRAVAKANAGAWAMATGVDLRYPNASPGRRPIAGRVLGRYMNRVAAAATVDPFVNAAFFDVIALLAEPASLLRPAVARRALSRRHAPNGQAPTWPTRQVEVEVT